MTASLPESVWWTPQEVFRYGIKIEGCARNYLMAAPQSLPEAQLALREVHLESLKSYRGSATKCIDVGAFVMMLYKDLTDLQPLSDLPVTHVSITSATRITNVATLAAFQHLQQVTFFNCMALSSIDALKACPNLQEISCVACLSLVNVDVLKEINPRKLKLKACGIWDLSFLSSGSRLQEANFSDCVQLTSVEELSVCRDLRVLDLSGCTALTSLNGIENCRRLQRLFLWNCSLIKTVEPLKSCADLEVLILDGCTSITALKWLRVCSRLRNVSLIECTQLKAADVEALEAQIMSPGGSLDR